MFKEKKIKESIAIMPQVLQDLVGEYNVEHRPNMKFVFTEMLRCVMCGVIEPELVERIYIDFDEIGGGKVICCSDSCQENFYYKKRNFLRCWRALKRKS